MITRVGYIARVTFASVEFVVILLGLLLHLMAPQFLASLSQVISEKTEQLGYLAVLPVASFMFSLNNARLLLFPGEGHTTALRKWSDYWKWRVHVFVGISYAFLFAAVAIIAWFGSGPVALVAMSIAITGSLVCAGSIWHASIVLSEILGKET